MTRLKIALSAAISLCAVLGAAYAQPLDATEVNKHLRDLATPSTCPAAVGPATEMSSTTAFANLPTAYQLVLLQALMRCAVDANVPEAAFAAVSKANALNATWGPKARIYAGVRFNRHDQIVDGFNQLARNSPSQIAALNSQQIWTIVHAAQRVDASGIQELSVYETLLTNGFKFSDREEDDINRVDHARLLMENGQTERARERLTTVTEPRLLMGIRLMKVFDPLRADPAFEQRLDLRAAAETNLAEKQREAAANPRLLRLVVQTSQSLRDLGRNEEALRLVDEALSRRRSFTDTAQQENWALEERANALRMLGRPDQARRASRRATSAPEGGEQNVSQTINYAATLEAGGRAKEALAMLENVGNASPYGDMWVAATRACAYDSLGDSARRDVQLSYLAAHEQDNVAARVRALICANKLDEAAELYVRRLGISAQRMNAIFALQTYAPNAGAEGSRQALLQARLRAVVARPDVQAALEKVGRIETIPLETVNWGEL